MSDDLDCVFCGDGYDSFNSLAYHVTHTCPNAPPAILAERLSGAQTMSKKRAPKTERSEGPKNLNGGLPDPSASRSASGNRPAFLRVEDIPSAGAVVKFDGTTRLSQSGYGDQILCGITIGKVAYTWGIKAGSKNHRMLTDLAGAKIPKGLTVRVKIKEFENDAHEEIRFIEIQKR